ARARVCELASEKPRTPGSTPRLRWRLTSTPPRHGEFSQQSAVPTYRSVGLAHEQMATRDADDRAQGTTPSWRAPPTPSPGRGPDPLEDSGLANLPLHEFTPNPDPLRDCGTGLRDHHLDATARAE